ncbi:MULTISPECIES: hypothetical protein [unclassified Caballeronia]|uniref:hypothetical protein n=1 Tax=unclassified Caballeronia TaxID=2646786 RepID=UPI00285C2457|nr:MULTISPECIES: hypothetical protein [unclassified Caballeronia]MDR5771500.1 hypothetical protein [Caballeronia sp. LZ002]MDR5805262.1 hypothetical protein [Caballeronia sp. LZ001]MDR5846936.1 hypothetical protein [Caballeronia sp. LZ003]
MTLIFKTLKYQSLVLVEAAGTKIVRGLGPLGHRLIRTIIRAVVPHRGAGYRLVHIVILLLLFLFCKATNFFYNVVGFSAKHRYRLLLNEQVRLRGKD